MFAFASPFHNRQHGLKQTANLKKHDLEAMCKPTSGLGKKDPVYTKADWNSSSFLSQEGIPKKENEGKTRGPTIPNNNSPFKFNKNVPNPYMATLPGRMA